MYMGERVGERHRPRRVLAKVVGWDAGASVGLALLTFVVHDVGYVLHTPYWNDEVWVAVSTKVPLHDVPAVIASSPIGWDLLLRLAPAGHPQAARLIPLGFSAATVLAAYWFIRALPWPSAVAGRVAAVAAGSIALISPAALIRNDLKQYTCDAFCVLVVLGLTSRAERDRTWWRLIALVVGGSALFIFANPAALALGAGLASLALVSLVRKDWRDLRRLIAVGVVGMMLLAGIYLTFYQRGNVGGLRTYWVTNFPPLSGGPVAVWHWFWTLAPTWFRGIGIGPVCLALPLLVAGAYAIARLGLPATGIAVPMLLAELVVLASIQQYPLFDPRTSYFLAIPVAVVGVVGGVACLLRLGSRQVGTATAIGAVLATALWHGTAARQHTIPVQATRQDVQTIKDGWRPHDVILANTNGSWVLAYYWGGAIRVTPTTSTQQKFQSESVGQPQTYYVCPQADGGRRPARTCFAPETMTLALNHLRAVTGSRVRIWVEALQARKDVRDAISAWAVQHGYSWHLPTRLAGSFLYLLIPDRWQAPLISK